MDMPVIYGQECCNRLMIFLLGKGRGKDYMNNIYLIVRYPSMLCCILNALREKVKMLRHIKGNMTEK